MNSSHELFLQLIAHVDPVLDGHPVVSTEPHMWELPDDTIRIVRGDGATFDLGRATTEDGDFADHGWDYATRVDEDDLDPQQDWVATDDEVIFRVLGWLDAKATNDVVIVTYTCEYPGCDEEWTGDAFFTDSAPVAPDSAGRGCCNAHYDDATGRMIEESE